MQQTLHYLLELNVRNCEYTVFQLVGFSRNLCCVLSSDGTTNWKATGREIFYDW
jgi:hypothetical protein